MGNEDDIRRLFAMADLITPMVIRSAASLRLADHVDSGIDTVAALAEATGCKRQPLSKVVDHLHAIGLLHLDTTGRIENSGMGSLLLSAYDSGRIRSFFDPAEVAGRAEMSITALLHTLRTGRPAYEGLYGNSLWDDTDGRADADQGLDRLAPAEPEFDADVVVNGYDWSGRRHVVDVGGHNGAMLAAILKTHSHLTGTLLDLGKFSELGTTTMRRHGVQDRASIVAGSFFDPLPTGGDVYLLSAIMADWGDEDAIRILSRCADAAGPEGRVVLAEVHMTTHLHLDPPLRTAMDVRLAASMPEPDRTVDDLCVLADKAGLDVVWRGPGTMLRSLVELRPRTAAGAP
ncbi:methyltransferase [Nocardia sp. CA-290969]|uniref:methyltransferase n=1 Tax=Nocardia sp. CA-290969 TaxID=3239986 RepID=UPI003D949605